MIKDNVKKEFGRRSSTYGEYNHLQKEIASYLVSKIKNSPEKILDLGAGQGEVLSFINWEFEKYVAADFAKEMRDKHPKEKNIEVLDINFNQPFADRLDNFDLVISSSSLQWAKDLEFTLNEVKKLTGSIAFAVFTDKTFKKIRDITKRETFLKPAPFVIQEVEKLFNVTSEIKEYTLQFNSKRELFNYIKKSGVSGGTKTLSYKETKDLIERYPDQTLEAQAVFFY